MIRITNFQGLKKESEPFDEIWAIVRSAKNLGPNIRQVQILSPDKELFFWYCGLSKAGQWTKEQFQNEYVPRFLAQLVKDGNKGVFDALNYLWRADKQGKRIALICYCKDENSCHRSIIAGLLQAVGCDVVTDTGNDYTAYKHMIDEMMKA